MNYIYIYESWYIRVIGPTGFKFTQWFPAQRFSGEPRPCSSSAWNAASLRAAVASKARMAKQLAKEVICFLCNKYMCMCICFFLLNTDT